MGKGDRRGKNRREKNEDDWAEEAALAPTRKRTKTGQYVRSDASNGIKALKATLTTRCMMAGKEATKRNMRDAKAPWWGCCAGRVIATTEMEEKERAELWGAICHVRRVIVNHDSALGLPNRHPICMRLLIASGWSDGQPKDTRPIEDRRRAADSALMRLEAWLGFVDKPAMSECKRVVIYDVPAIDKTGLLLALRVISIGLAGKEKEMKYIGRG